MTDDGLEDLLRETARDYHDPVPTPREAMWKAIERNRRAAHRRPLAAPGPGRWLPLAAAAGLLLATGIGIGRLSQGDPVVPPAATTAGAEATPEAHPTAYRLATLEHLSQSEEFLTLFRTAVGQDDHHLASATARRLLGTNRLLLDSPAATDPRTRLLLEDLELVLAGIAQLSEVPRQQDVDLITEGLERGNVMPRLRTAVPSGAAPSQGAL
ncbi:MAG TPA: hypothetical protein VFZ26_18290 [Gemmatimonadales bacterium]